MSPNILVVHNAVPAKTSRTWMNLAKSRPGDLTFASAGSGSPPHMAAELFRSIAGLDIRHIPYKGGVAAIPDLLGGRVTMMFSPIAVVLPAVREGKLRALAVTSLATLVGGPGVADHRRIWLSGFEYGIGPDYSRRQGPQPRSSTSSTSKRSKRSRS